MEHRNVGALGAPIGLSKGERDLFTETLRQAEALAPGPWRVHEGRLASPAPFRLAKERGIAAEVCAQALAQSLSLADTWFSQAIPLGGYVNLTLRPAWYGAVAAEPAWAGVPVTTPVPALPAFPAEILPADWRCLCRGSKRPPTPALAARQDRGNPAWLVRYTAERLEQLSQRPEGDRTVVSEKDQALLLLAAEFAHRSQRDTPAQLFRYLTGLAQQVWQFHRFTGPAAGRCARVLAAGYAQLSQP